MSDKPRFRIERINIDNRNRKITAYVRYLPEDLPEEEKARCLEILRKKSNCEALDAVFEPEATQEAKGEEAPEYAPAPSEADVPAEAVGDTYVPYTDAPEGTGSGEATPPIREPYFPEAPGVEAPARETPAEYVRRPETVSVDFSMEEYEREQQEHIREDARYNSRSGGGYSGENGNGGYRNGGGFYNGKGNGKRSKKNRITPAEGEEPKKDRDGNVILIGRDFDAETVRMCDVTSESGFVAVRGRVFHFEDKKLSSGSYIAILMVTDETYSVSGKFFLQPEDVPYVEQFFAQNKYVRIFGEAVTDKYTHELTLMCQAIIASKQTFRMDNAPVKRVELHLHTLMSAVDAITRPAELMETLARWGHDAVAITDHGVVQGYSEITSIYYSKYKDKLPDFKFLYGCEGYLCHRTPDMSEEEAKKLPTYHIIILVKDEVGLKNLYKLVSKAHLDYYHKRPRIPQFELDAHREGLILGSACALGELYSAMIEGAPEEKLEEIASYYDYLEIQPVGNNEFLVREGTVDTLDDVRNYNKRILAIGDKLGKLTVATCDVHYLNPEDAIYRSVMQAGQGYDDYMNQPPVYLRTTEEMLA